MSDLISKRAVLAKINLWANGELSTDKLIESIKKMSGGSLTDRPCEYCKNHVDGWCKAWKCVFDDMLTTKEEQALLQRWRDNRGVSIKEFEEAMDALQEPKTGHWIYDKNIENWRCSECGETPKTLGYCGTADFMAEHFKYCNHCGTKMAEGSGEE